MCLVCRFWKIWPDALCSACVWCSTLRLYPPQLFATQNDQLLLRNGLETKDLQSEADFRAYQGWILGFTVRRTPYFLEHITMLAKCFLKSNSPGHKRCLGSLIEFIKLVFRKNTDFKIKFCCQFSQIYKQRSTLLPNIHHSLYYLNFPVLVMYKDDVLFGAKPLIKQNRKC